MSFFNSKRDKQEEQEEEINLGKEILNMIVYIAVIIALVYVILHYVGQRTEVIGSSMNDTLSNEDNLWIDKLSYRFTDPKRFDIIVFPFEDTDTYYIKRIIGLPGETVYIDPDGNIYIDDKLLEEDYGKETINVGMIGLASSPLTLGEEEYFVMGDNRNNSQDSRRAEVGNIKFDDIEGKAVFRMWPLKRIGFVD